MEFSLCKEKLNMVLIPPSAQKNNPGRKFKSALRIHYKDVYILKLDKKY
jgi:hypothetical protein